MTESICTKCDHEWADHHQAYSGRYGCAGWCDGCSCDGFSDDPEWLSKPSSADDPYIGVIKDMWAKEVVAMTQPSPIVSRVNREREATE